MSCFLCHVLSINVNVASEYAIIGFEEHEWDKHGKCAGVKNADDFFAQVCALSHKPLKIMDGKKSLEAAHRAVVAANFEVVHVDTRNSQLSLSACLHSESGRWFLRQSKISAGCTAPITHNCDY